MITQGTKNFYFLDPPDLSVVVDRLRAAGYREAPHWYLTKRGAGLLITPKTLRTGFGFRLWAAPAVLDAYGDLFEHLPIEAFVAHLLRDDWQERYSLYLVGHKVAISIVESIGRAGTSYHLDIRGFRPQMVRALLESIGVEQLSRAAPREERP
jgi:hypothetical protein